MTNAELLGLIRERVAYRNMAFQLQTALQAILALHPADTDEGYNEWGEAECFCKARRIALDTMKALEKEYGSESRRNGSDDNRSPDGDSGSGSSHLAGAFA
jgi:hypothetical protein